MSRSVTSRTRLDRAAVIQAAADLVNSEGAEGLTINRLARKVEVQPPSLYNHISGLADVWAELAILNITTLGDRITRASVGRSGPGAVRALARAYREHIQECPGLYQASLRASRNTDPPDPRLQAAEDRVVQVALAVVESFGLAGDEAIHAVRALRSLVHGFATLEAAGGFGLALPLNVSFDWLVDMAILRLESASRKRP